MKIAKEIIEGLLLRADEAPLDGFVRMLLGYATALAGDVRHGPAPLGWTFLLFFFVILLSLRVVPIAIRKVVHFSRAANAAWAQRRLIAKHFDSYQWRKLFWIGLGLALYGLQVPRAISDVFVVLTAGCVLFGAVGLWRFKLAQRLPWPMGANMNGGLLNR
jgi:hypothetical protein